MSLYLEGRNVGFKFRGEFIDMDSIPKNPYAKLMYYLSCVQYVLNGPNFKDLTDYENYINLSSEEKELIVTLVYLLDPNKLIEYGIFILNEEITDFVELSDERVKYLNIENSIQIGEYHITVIRRMFVQNEWIKFCVIDPLKIIFGISKPSVVYRTERRVIEDDSSSSEEVNYTHKDNFDPSFLYYVCCMCSWCSWNWCDCYTIDTCNCCMFILFILSVLFPPFGLVLLFIGCTSSNEFFRPIGCYGMIIGVILYIVLISL